MLKIHISCVTNKYLAMILFSLIEIVLYMAVCQANLVSRKCFCQVKTLAFAVPKHNQEILQTKNSTYHNFGLKIGSIHQRI